MTSRAALLAALLAVAACVQQPDKPSVPSAPPPPVRSRSESNRDDALKAVIQRHLAEADRQALRAVTAEVWQGRVFLLGAVVKPDHRRKAERVAAATDGIAGVVNEVVLAEDKALEAFAPDPVREDQVRQALGIEGKAGIIVRVVNNVAFLLGAAAGTEQAEQLKADALDVDGIKWAVAHLRMPGPGNHK